MTKTIKLKKKMANNVADAAAAAWKNISPKGLVDDNLRMFEAGVEFERLRVIQEAEMFPERKKRTPKEILDELFKGLSPEEYREKWQLLNELTGNLTTEMLHYKTELYKRETAEMEGYKKRKNAAVKEQISKARSEAVGILDAVAAMLNHSRYGTHREKTFYAESMIRFINDAKKELERKFIPDDELPF